MDDENSRMIVVAALIEEAGRLLVCKRPPGKPQAGFWEFPGGKVLPGEEHPAALRREIMEELGVEITVSEIYDCALHSYEFGHVDLVFYRAEIVAGTPEALHHEEIRWLKPDELDSVEFLPADKELIRKLQS